MEAGEKELRSAFEQVTTRNVQGVVDFSNDTRRLVLELKDHVASLEGTIRSKDAEIAEIKKQLSNLQRIIYAGGTS